MPCKALVSQLVFMPNRCLIKTNSQVRHIYLIYLPDVEGLACKTINS